MKKDQRAMHLIAIEEKVAFYLLNYGFNIRINITEKKEVLAVLIHLKVLKQPSQKFWPKILTPYYFTVNFI